MEAIAATGTPQPLGPAGVQQRIAAIRSMVGAHTVWNLASPGAPNARASDANDFGLLLERAQAGTANAAATATTSPRGASTASRDTTAPAATLDAISAAPLFNTKPSGLPATSISEERQAAGNGRLPDELLTSIGDGHRLATPAAQAYLRMESAARRDGVTIGLTDSYRNYDGQVDIAARLGIYGQGGWAAVPGTSNHGWGLSLDLDLDDGAQGWMRENGWRYGYFEDIPDEPWHWTYRAG